MLTLSPSINKHKNVICSDTQNDKDDQIVQERLVTYLKQSLVYQGCHWKAKQYQKNANKCKKKRSEMNDEVNDNEEDWKDGESQIIIYHLVYFFLGDSTWDNSELNTIWILFV